MVTCRLNYLAQTSWCSMYAGKRRCGLIAIVALTTPMAVSAQAAPASGQADRDAAYLEQAFSHNLCARDDRELRKLTKALSKKAIAASH
jgi:hypothetical protein